VPSLLIVPDAGNSSAYNTKQNGTSTQTLAHVGTISVTVGGFLLMVVMWRGSVVLDKVQHTVPAVLQLWLVVAEMTPNQRTLHRLEAVKPKAQAESCKARFTTATFIAQLLVTQAHQSAVPLAAAHAAHRPLAAWAVQGHIRQRLVWKLKWHLHGSAKSNNPDFCLDSTRLL
jgi:hypothetical protein